MANTTPQHKQKKSQKRKDRQARRTERQQLRQSGQHIDYIAKLKICKKSLPGFLAKNAKSICQWLKDYTTLFVMADDYGIQRLDRLPEDRRHQLVQDYIDVNEFILIVEQMSSSNDVSDKEVTQVDDVTCSEVENDEIEEDELATSG